MQRETIVTTEYKIMYKALEKLCTKIHEIKEAHICSGLLFSEIITHDRDGGIQIKKKDICRLELYRSTETKSMSGNV